MFDYVVTPVPAVDGVEIVVGSAADADTAKWFPDLKRGMEAGWVSLQKHDGHILSGVRVEVTKIHAHPMDTTACGCERYGRIFIIELGRHRAIRVMRARVQCPRDADEP